MCEIVSDVWGNETYQITAIINAWSLQNDPFMSVISRVNLDWENSSIGYLNQVDSKLIHSATLLDDYISYSEYICLDTVQ